MSVLHSRIIRHGGQGNMGLALQNHHPAGTRATPMVMPLARVTYLAGTGFYETIYPSPPAAGDPNAVPLATVAPGVWGHVIPAGHP